MRAHRRDPHLAPVRREAYARAVDRRRAAARGWYRSAGHRRGRRAILIGNLVRHARHERPQTLEYQVFFFWIGCIESWSLRHVHRLVRVRARRTGATSWASRLPRIPKFIATDGGRAITRARRTGARCRTRAPATVSCRTRLFRHRDYSGLHLVTMTLQRATGLSRGAPPVAVLSSPTTLSIMAV